MALPKYTKITRNGVEFIDNSDRVMYTITELSRAAMMEVGKYIITKARGAFYNSIKRITGSSGWSIQYWVPKRDDDGNELEVAELIVGFKVFDPKKNFHLPGFKAAFQELGTDHQKKVGVLFNSVNDSIGEIRKIEAQYLSAINAPDSGESLIDESEALGED